MECRQVPAVHDCFQYTKTSYLKGVRCSRVSSARENDNFSTFGALFYSIKIPCFIKGKYQKIQENSTFDLGC